MSEDSLYSIDVVAVKLKTDYKYYSDMPITSPHDACMIACQMLENNDRESVAVFHLATDGRPISVHIAAIGTINSCIVHPRELLKAAILSNTDSILLVHNHPSGSLTPSRYDIEITDRISRICNDIGIRLIDHIIVAGGMKNTYLSMLEEGILIRDHDEMVVSKERLTSVAERSFSYGSSDITSRHR